MNVSVRHLAVAAIAVLTVAMSACGGDAVTDTRVLSGFQLTPAPSVADLSMPDASAGDTDFAFVAPAGQLLLVYFGYTSCPDVCPTSLSDVKHALATLGDRDALLYSANSSLRPDTTQTILGFVWSASSSPAFINGRRLFRTNVIVGDQSGNIEVVLFKIGRAHV